MQPESTSQALHCACSLSQAVAEIHDRGVVHLDLKPSNLLLCRENPAHSLRLDFTIKLVDFGIAGYVEASTGELVRSQSVGASLPLASK